MNAKTVSFIALLLAILAIVLQFESRVRLEKRVQKIVDERERNYCAQLAIKLNESRELMGLKPVKPENFAEVLTAYFESMATVMSGGISSSPPIKTSK
jgi:hypothetical protein